VIDYTKENFTKNKNQYHLILDVVAHYSAFAYARALKTDGIAFFVGGSVLTLFQILLMGPLIRKIRRKRVQILAVPQNRKDLLAITELCITGKVRPVIDRQYKFNQIHEAMRYVSEGHAKGKVVITMI
jgi:NADPH:quinone reductase-like Zn-dependent oxidoreductase